MAIEVMRREWQCSRVEKGRGNNPSIMILDKDRKNVCRITQDSDGCVAVYLEDDFRWGSVTGKVKLDERDVK